MRLVIVGAILALCARAAAQDQEGDWGVLVKLAAQAPPSASSGGEGLQGAEDWGVFAKIREAERQGAKTAGQRALSPAEGHGAPPPAPGVHAPPPSHGAYAAAALREAVAARVGCSAAGGLALPGALPGVLACLRAALREGGRSAGRGDEGARDSHLRMAVAATYGPISASLGLVGYSQVDSYAPPQRLRQSSTYMPRATRSKVPHS